MTGDLITSNSIQFRSGTDSNDTPGFTWNNDTDTGMYRVAANTIGFATGGVNRLTLSSTGLTGVGTGLTALNATNISSGTIDSARLPAATLAVQGAVILNSNINSTSTTQAATSSAVKIAYDLANTANNANNFALLTTGGTMTGDLITSNSIRFRSGTDSNDAPGFTWNNDPDTGMYRVAANTIGFATGGTNIGTFDVNGLTVDNKIVINSLNAQSYGLFMGNATAISGVGNAFGASLTDYWASLNSNQSIRHKIGMNNARCLDYYFESGNLAEIATAAFGLRNSSGTNTYIYVYNSNIGIRNATPQYSLDVTGTANITSTLNVSGATTLSSTLVVTGKTTFNNDVTLGAGVNLFINAADTASAPGISWIGDTNTGMYRIGAGNIGFSIIGVNRMSLSAGSLTVTNAGNNEVTLTNNLNGNAKVCLAYTGGSFSTSANINDLVIRNESNIIIQSGNGAGALKIAATNNIIIYNQITSENDSVTAPVYSWSNDPTTGMYRAGTNSIGFTTGGVNRLTLSSTGIAGVGTGLTALNATNISSGTIDSVRLPAATLSVQGAVILNSNINSTSTTQAATAGAVKTAYDLANTANTAVNSALPLSGGTMTGDLITSSLIQFKSGTDSNNAPGFTWSANANTGMYRVAANSIGFATAGINRVTINNTGTSIAGTMTVTGTTLFNNDVTLGSAVNLYINSNDSVSAPGISWVGDTSTGMYRISACNIGFATGGVNSLTLSSAGLTGIGSGLTALNATNISSGTIGSARLPAATLAAQGAVILNNTVTSTSTSAAATANAVKTAYDLANAALPLSGGTMTGDLINSNSIQFRSGTDSATAPGYTWNNDTNTGMYRVSADSIGFATAGINRVTINNTSTTLSSNLVVGSNLAAYGPIHNLGTSTGPTRLYLNDIANASWEISTFNYRLSFNNNNGGTFSQKMSIDSSGNCDIYGNCDISGNHYFRIWNSNGVNNWWADYNGNMYGAGNWTSVGYIAVGTNLTVGGNITATGTVTANGTVLTSDDRIKTDEKFISNATDNLLKMRPQLYNKHKFVTGSSNHPLEILDESIVESGLIAQELFYDCPDLRHLISVPPDADSNVIYTTTIPDSTNPSIDPDYSAWGTSTAAVNYIGLIPYLIKGFQEQNLKIMELISKNEELTARINGM